MGCGGSKANDAREPDPQKERAPASPEEIQFMNEERRGRIQILEDYWTEIVAEHPLTMERVATHTTADSIWSVIHDNVFDLTAWADEHPGGKDPILRAGGRDSTKEFDMLHGKTTKAKMGKGHHTFIGSLFNPDGALEGFSTCVEPLEEELAEPDAAGVTARLAEEEADARDDLIAEYWAGIAEVHPFSDAQIAQRPEGRIWTIIRGLVFDMTDWPDSHPGGRDPIVRAAGQDATSDFDMMHGEASKKRMNASHSMYIGARFDPQADVATEGRYGSAFTDCVDRPASEQGSAPVPDGNPLSAESVAPGGISASGYSECVIGSVDNLTGDTKGFTIAFDDKTFELPMKPGGHILLEVPLDGDDTAVRPYSPVEVAAGSVRVVVKQYQGGKGSGFWHAREPGDRVRLCGPLQPKFDCDAFLKQAEAASGGARIVLVGGGTGAAPIVSIARAAAESTAVRSLIVILCFRSRSEAFLVEECKRAIESAGDRASLYVVYSRAEDGDSPAPIAGECVRTARLSAAVLKEVCGEQEASPSDGIVVCGPPPLNSAFTDMAVDAGFERSSVVVMD